MAIKPIALSFKDTKEDIELYEWIKSHSGYSSFVKDTLRTVKENESSKKENKSIKVNEPELIDLEF